MGLIFNQFSRQLCSANASRFVIISRLKMHEGKLISVTGVMNSTDVSGIITPPTEECRGTTDAEQSAASILYDYPSVGFLKYLLELKRVYLVASVTNDVYENATE